MKTWMLAGLPILILTAGCSSAPGPDPDGSNSGDSASENLALVGAPEILVAPALLTGITFEIKNTGSEPVSLTQVSLSLYNRSIVQRAADRQIAAEDVARVQINFTYGIAFLPTGEHSLALHVSSTDGYVEGIVHYTNRIRVMNATVADWDSSGLKNVTATLHNAGTIPGVVTGAYIKSDIRRVTSHLYEAGKPVAQLHVAVNSTRKLTIQVDPLDDLIPPDTHSSSFVIELIGGSDRYPSEARIDYPRMQLQFVNMTPRFDCRSGGTCTLQEVILHIRTNYPTPAYVHRWSITVGNETIPWDLPVPVGLRGRESEITLHPHIDVAPRNWTAIRVDAIARNGQLLDEIERQIQPQ